MPCVWVPTVTYPLKTLLSNLPMRLLSIEPLFHPQLHSTFIEWVNEKVNKHDQSKKSIAKRMAPKPKRHGDVSWYGALIPGTAACGAEGAQSWVGGGSVQEARVTDRGSDWEGLPAVLRCGWRWGSVSVFHHRCYNIKFALYEWYSGNTYIH